MSVATTVSAARSHESSATISISGAVDSTLTIEQLGFRSLTLIGALTASVNVFFPATASDIGSWWIVTNSLSGAFTLTCKNTTGTGVVVASGKTALLKWDGTNLVPFPTDSAASTFAKSGANSDITSLSAISAGITAAGGLNLGGSLGGNSAGTAALNLATASVAFSTDADQTPAAAVYACPILTLTGAGPTVTRNLILPLTAGAFYIVLNSVTGQSITVKGATGTGITIPTGRCGFVRADGTNFLSAHNDVTDLTIGAGTTVTKLAVYTPSLSPSSVAANTTAEQTFTVTGLVTASDTVLVVSKPTAQAGLGIVGWRCSADNTLAITFANVTGSPIVPTASQTYRVVALRS